MANCLLQHSMILHQRRKGFYSGVDDYMVKPVDMDEMAAYVNGEEVPILPREFNVLYRK